MKKMHDKNLVGLIKLVLLMSLVYGPLASAAPSARLLPFWEPHSPHSDVVIDHSAWQSLLDVYLDDKDPSGINLFDYTGVSVSDRLKLQSYLDQLQQIDPRELNRTEQRAYWLNLYNATTVQLVVSRAPIKSIRSVRSGFFSSGPWNLKLLTIAKQKLSLNDIEHRILRPIWYDPLLHFGLNCASMGCPDLLPTAFTSRNTDTLLKNAAKRFLAHPRGLTIESENTMVLSKIFSWYQEDFGSNEKAMVRYLQQYMSAEQASIIAVIKRVKYSYDWNLNQKKS